VAAAAAAAAAAAVGGKPYTTDAILANVVSSGSVVNRRPSTTVMYDAKVERLESSHDYRRI